MSESPKTTKSRRSPLKGQRQKPLTSSAKIRKVVSLGLHHKQVESPIQLQKASSISESPLKDDSPIVKGSHEDEQKTFVPVLLPIPQELEPIQPAIASIASMSEKVAKSEADSAMHSSRKSEETRSNKSAAKENNTINMNKIVASLRKELQELSSRELMELAIYILRKEPEERTKKRNQHPHQVHGICRIFSTIR